MSRLRFVLAMAGREARAARARLVFLVLAVAVGVASPVALNSFTHSLQASVARQARALLGADLGLGSGAPFSPAAEARLARLVAEAGAGTSLARVTSFASMVYVPRTSGARLAQVAAVEPRYPFYGAIRTEPAGQWARLSEGSSALVDPSLLAALDARVGDTLALGNSRLTILGTAHDVPGDVGLRSALGPRVFVAARDLATTGLLVFGSRARYEAFLKLPESAAAQRLADRHRSAFAAARVTLRTVAEDQRRVDRNLGRFGRYLGLAGLVAMLLAGLGVASAVHVFLRRKLDTVAVLRCLGATAGVVMAVYLVQAAAVGLVGSLLGAALGALAQLLLPRVLSGLLPVDVEVGLSWPAVGAGIGVGLWVATIFSLLPLLGVRQVSPLLVLRRDFEPRRRGADPLRRLALAGLAASVVLLAVLQTEGLWSGLAFAAGIGVVLGALALAARGLMALIRRVATPRLPYVWRQGLANLRRPANQTLTVALTLGFGAFLLATLYLVQVNLAHGLQLDQGVAPPNLVLFDVQTDQRAPLEELVRSAGHTLTRPVPIVPMRIASLKGVAVGQQLAVPPKEGTPAAHGRWALRREYRSSYRDVLGSSERVVKGAWWRAGEWRGRKDGALPVSLEAEVARELGVGVGDEIVWDIQGVPLTTHVASLRHVEWARFEPNFFAVFPEGPLDAAPQTFAAFAHVPDAVARGRLQRRLAERFPNLMVLDLTEVQGAIRRILDRIGDAARFLALFSLAAGVVVLLGALGANQDQRVREGVLLKTLGATRGQVARVVLSESLALGALAAATGLLLAMGASWALARFVFELELTLPAAPLAAIGLGLMGLTGVVGAWSSAEVFRSTPLAALRDE